MRVLVTCITYIVYRCLNCTTTNSQPIEYNIIKLVPSGSSSFARKTCIFSTDLSSISSLCLAQYYIYVGLDLVLAPFWWSLTARSYQAPACCCCCGKSLSGRVVCRENERWLLSRKQKKKRKTVERSIIYGLWIIEYNVFISGDVLAKAKRMLTNERNMSLRLIFMTAYNMYSLLCGMG